jgi:hypothetical protein
MRLRSMAAVSVVNLPGVRGEGHTLLPIFKCYRSSASQWLTRILGANATAVSEGSATPYAQLSSEEGGVLSHPQVNG